MIYFKFDHKLNFVFYKIGKSCGSWTVGVILGSSLLGRLNYFLNITKLIIFNNKIISQTKTLRLYIGRNQ